MPKKQIGKKIDEQGNLNDLGYTVTQEEINNWNNKVDKDVNNLTNYTLATNTASSIEMSIDNSTYVVSLKLKNAEGTQLGDTQTIDLPLESVVVNGAYDSTTKEVVLTLDNGSEIRFSVADLVSGLATTTDLANYVPTSRTVNGKALSSNISLGNKDVGALPDYTLTISHQSVGNPRMVKFASVNYSSAATCFKMGAMTCHDNGVSYQFLTDMLIAVTKAGNVTANIYKFAQSSIGSVDGVARYTGDVFYVNDTTNKIVDFYILCGQWSASQFTPITKVGSTTIANVTQYSGSATYYSSGTKEWATGCGTTYARSNEIPTKTSQLENDSGFSTFSGSYNDLTNKPTNLVTTDTEQTITGKKAFSGNGLKVSGRANGSGDDEGIVVSKATNNYAGICLGDPSGKRAVLYLLPDGSSVWRLHNGSSNYDIKHPGKAGTVALTSDIPTSYLSTIARQATVYQENTNVEGESIKITDNNGTATTFTNWTNFGNATTTENGLMSASDKAKLNNIDTQPRHFTSGDSGRTEGTYTYYKLASFPVDNSGNACSLIINGRIGGWNKGNKGSISMIISNRDGVDGIGTILGNADTSLTDLVVYTNSDNTATMYVKTYSWFAFDLTLGLMSGTTDAWDGVGSTTTPSGTLAWSLSSAKSKFLTVADDGTTYVKGNSVATQNQLGTQATFSLSGTTLTITPK